MQKITILAIAITVIVTLVLAAGIYLSQKPPSTPIGPYETPSSTATTPVTPSLSPTATPITSPNVSSNNTIAKATSYQFSMEMGATVVPYTCYVKNDHSPHMAIRIEMPSINQIYILNSQQQKSWVFRGEAWSDTSSGFIENFAIWNATVYDYKDALASWNGFGDFIYQSEEGTVKLYNIILNPSLDDSLFEHVF